MKNIEKITQMNSEDNQSEKIFEPFLIKYAFLVTFCCFVFACIIAVTQYLDNLLVGFLISFGILMAMIICGTIFGIFFFYFMGKLADWLFDDDMF